MQVQLEQAFLQHVHDCVSAGNLEACFALGLNLEVLRIISEMPISEVRKLSKSEQVSILNRVSIDATELRKLSVTVAKKRAQDQLVDELLMAGASGKMLKHFFGIWRKEICVKRKLLSIEQGIGRHGQDGIRDDKGQILATVADAMASMAGADRASSEGRCRALLQASRVHGCSVAAIWEMAEKATQSGAWHWGLTCGVTTQSGSDAAPQPQLPSDLRSLLAG